MVGGGVRSRSTLTSQNLPRVQLCLTASWISESVKSQTVRRLLALVANQKLLIHGAPDYPLCSPSVSLTEIICSCNNNQYFQRHHLHQFMG